MDIFTEIEIEAPQNTTNELPQTLSKPCPIRERIYDMRSMAIGNPNTWGESKLFYRQGKFMENISDTYTESKMFSMYSPCYQRLDYEELRTFFTWRTLIRAGETPRASLSCVFLYVYELLLGIGVKSPEEGLEQLIFTWQAYRPTLRALDDYIPPWLLDYHIYYGLDFLEFIQKHNRYYTKQLMYEPDQPDLLLSWNKFSKYDITASKFYQKDNGQLMSNCFQWVIKSLHKKCEEKNLKLIDLFAYKSYSVGWNPFRRAPFQNWYKQDDRQVEIPGGRVYTCRGNRWESETRVEYNFAESLIAYIIKQSESRLREITGYKTKLNASKSSIYKVADTLLRLNLSYTDIVQAINTGTEEFYQDLTKVVVNVNSQNLNKIRTESQETQEKLIVEPQETETESPQPPPEKSQQPTADIWQTLKQALTPIQQEALKTPKNIPAIAAENGIMPEILVDNINEKAMDIIGDNILNEYEIYEEYIDYI